MPIFPMALRLKLIYWAIEKYHLSYKGAAKLRYA